MIQAEVVILFAFMFYNGMRFADLDWRVKIPTKTRIIMYLLNPFAVMLALGCWSRVLQGVMRPPRKMNLDGTWGKRKSKKKSAPKPTFTTIGESDVSKLF